MTNRLSSMCALALGMTIAAPLSARAQTAPNAQAKTFINVSAGAQLDTRSVKSVNAFELFQETATVSASPTIDRGLVIDASVGRRVWHNLILSLDFSSFHTAGGTTAFTASIPSPVFFNQPTTTTGSVTEFEQSTLAGSIIVTWLHPLTDTVDLAVFLGPSFMKVTQSIVTASVPASGLLTISTTTESRNTAKAGMLGVDLGYKFNSRYGAGLFVRYARAEVDLPSSPKMKVGGLQAGVGLRVRF